MPDDLALADDLIDFIDRSPSPFHAVAELGKRLEAAGFSALSEADPWRLTPGGRHYVVRDGSIVAFRVGTEPPCERGFRILGAHTDSPGFRVRPRVDVYQAGYRLVSVEPYGAPLFYTWLDRDLTVAGIVVLRDGTTRLVSLEGAPLRLASLAIHLNRQVNEQLSINPQDDLVPMWSVGDPARGDDFLAVVAAAAGVDSESVAAHELALVPTEPGARVGADRSLIASARLDNLLSCHASLCALLASEASPHGAVMVCNDHEEIGSTTSSGARGSFLEDVLRRLVAEDDPEPESVLRAISRSILVSADMAHAVHPNHADRHDRSHQPVLGGGPVVKVNAKRSYATDAGGLAWFAERCREAGVALQYYASRADIPCGSTIGPLVAARLGVRTVDVGAAMLAMHSCRELASAVDVTGMVSALTACLA